MGVIEGGGQKIEESQCCPVKIFRV